MAKWRKRATVEDLKTGLKAPHPTTLSEAEEAMIVAFHQLRTHLADFMPAYTFARRLKTLSGLTPYEYIAKIWTSEPDRFILNPINQMPRLNT